MFDVFDQITIHQQHIPSRQIDQIFHDKHQNDEVYMDDQHSHE